MSSPARSCGRSFFPEARWEHVPPRAVQEALRDAFAAWGRPGNFRVDNGSPWGSRRDLPSDLALWILGLEVGMDWILPGRPQENGVVERSQGVSQNWAEPWKCATPQQLQEHLDAMDAVQRAEYPAVGSQSRLQAYPQLKHSGRRYSRRWEQSHWSLAAAHAYLAELALVRQVDRNGTVSLYHRTYYVGKREHCPTIHVFFDPQTQEWVFTDPEGRQLRARYAAELTRERIVALEVSPRRHRKSSRK